VRSERADAVAADSSLQGCYAGCVTRLVAFAIDVVVALSLFALAANVLEYIVSALVGHEERLRDLPVLAIVLLVLWFGFYLVYPLASTGRTAGMAVLGLRTVRADGAPLEPRRALLRTVAFPLSVALLGISLAMIVVRRDRRALHDLIASSAVVYAWDARAARLRFLAARQS
jgi:uncharacterized RDD family membrane protein YckC